MSEPADTNAHPTLDGERRVELVAIVALGIYYVARMVFYAVRLGPGVPPDEGTHVGIIELYSKTPFLVADSPESYSLGLVTHVPYLYHLLMGKVLALGVPGIDPLLLLRLLNVGLASAGFVVAWRLAVAMTDSVPARVLFVVMVSNVPMFTFLGAAVSYDNLVNLLAVSSILSLISFLRSGRPESLMLLLLWIALGALTKITFLPLALILVVAVVVDRRGALFGDVKELARLLVPRRPLWLAAGALTFLAGVLGAGLYGENLARHGRLAPSCSEVLPLEACLENRIFARNHIVVQFRDGSLTLDAAIQRTQLIPDRGDRDHALRLIQNEAAYQRAGSPDPISVWNYWSLAWNEGMMPSIFGIQAHQSALRSGDELLPYLLVFLLAFLAWVRLVPFRGAERLWLIVGLVAIAYALILVGYVFYGNYVASHAPLLGVQGRYVFPVLVPFLLIVAEFLTRPLPGPARWFVVALVGLLFLAGDLPFVLRSDSEAWYVAASPVSWTPSGQSLTAEAVPHTSPGLLDPGLWEQRASSSGTFGG